MSLRYSERIQELRREIVRELNGLGFRNVNFYFPSTPKLDDAPYIEYKMTKPVPECRGLRDKIANLIGNNIEGTDPKGVNWDRCSDRKNKVLRARLILSGERIENPQTMEHGLLSLVNQEIRNYKLRTRKR